MPVNTILQLRRGAASLWTSTNPTLAAGEVGYETDTGLFKVGDGTTGWTSLKYSALPPTGINGAPYFGSGVYNVLTQGSGISLAYNTGTGKTTINLSNPTIQSSDITDFIDSVNDRVADLLTPGSNISIVYADSGNTNSTLTVSVTGISLSGHTHILSNITDVTATATEVNYLSGVILGSGVASRVVVLDSNKDLQGLRNLTLEGNLTVNGQTTTVNSTTTTLDDPIITLGGDTAPVGTDTKDRGVEFRYWDDGTNSAKIGFFGYDDSTGKFIFLTSATNTNEAFSGTTGTIDANIEWSSVLSKPDPVVTVNLTGEVTGSGSATLTDLGNGTINVGTTVTHPVATTGILGIASFDGGDFIVSSGSVSIKTSGVGNSQLENDRITIGQTPLVLGSTYSAISGISSINPIILTYFAIDGGSP